MDDQQIQNDQLYTKLDFTVDKGKGWLNFLAIKTKASTAEGRWRNPVSPSSSVTPAGASTSPTSRIYGITTHTHTHPPLGGSMRVASRMTRMTGPDCAVMWNLINTHTHTHTHTEVARLRRRFSFVLQQALSFRTRHHLCRQGVALASTRRPHSQGPASVQAHLTGGVTGSEGQEGANGVGGGIGVGGGNGDGNGDVGGRGDGDGAGAETGVDVNEGAQDGNGDEAGTRTGTGVGTRNRTPQGNGDGSEDCSGDGNGDGDDGNENRFVEGGREAKKRKKP